MASGRQAMSTRERTARAPGPIRRELPSLRARYCERWRSVQSAWDRPRELELQIVESFPLRRDGMASGRQAVSTRETTARAPGPIRRELPSLRARYCERWRSVQSAWDRQQELELQIGESSPLRRERYGERVTVGGRCRAPGTGNKSSNSKSARASPSVETVWRAGDSR